MSFQFASVTSRGGRDQNEDSFFVAERGGLLAAVVADGCGGHEDGELASAAVCSAFERLTENWSPASVTEAAVAGLVRECDRAVRTHPRAEGGMRSTVAMALASGRGATVAHIGDTRIYHLRGKDVLYQSGDHSVSQIAVLSGEITPEQIRSHVDRNKLFFTMGGDLPANVRAESLGPFADGDGVLLCTDGFWEYVLEDEMAPRETAREWLDAMLARYASRARERCDNYTALTMIYKEDTPCV